MSSAQVIAPMDSAAVKPRRGFSSIKTIFSNSSSKRHTIAHPIPTNSSSTSLDDTAAGSTSPSSPVSSSAEEEEQETSSSTKRMSSIFTASPQRKQRQLEKAAEKAAEKEKKDQEKQAIQLFSVDEHGAFVPPTPLEKGYRDHFVDNNEDYFNTIISTPPERVRSFLSAASTISPEMFSPASSKIKRHTISSFRFSQLPQVPSKDTNYHSDEGHSFKRPVQASYLTECNQDDLADALSDSIGSLASSALSSPSREEVPDLMMDDDDHGSSSSAASSPRHSPSHSIDATSSVKGKQVMRDLPALGSELPIGF